MKRFLLLGLLAAPALGCTSLTPVGPLVGKKTATRSASQPNAIVTSPQDIGAMPTFADAPPPPAPTRGVTVGDVTPENAHDAAKKLQMELDRDRKATAEMPNYAEVSRIERNGR